MKTLLFELSKELTSLCKEKGIVMPESYFNWFKDNNGYYLARKPQDDYDTYIAPAYMLDELMDWLPNKIEEDTTTYFKTLMHNYNKEYLAYYDDSNCGWIPGSSFFQFDPNPCIAVAKLLIWCIKEGYVK
jgi:hypothetical protein